MWATTEAQQPWNLTGVDADADGDSSGGFDRSLKLSSHVPTADERLEVAAEEICSFLLVFQHRQSPKRLADAPSPPAEERLRAGPTLWLRCRCLGAFLQAASLHCWTVNKLLRHTPLMSFIWLQPRLARRLFSFCHWFVHRTRHTCPLALVDWSQNTYSSRQSGGYQPVGAERPGLASAFPTGVAEKHIPLRTYLSAPLAFTCSWIDLCWPLARCSPPPGGPCGGRSK